MQWTPEVNAGFTSTDVEPWLPVSETHPTVNVETQLAAEDSLLNVYRRLLALRKRQPALRIGTYMSHPSSNDELFVFQRKTHTEVMTVALNFADTPATVSVGAGKVVFSTRDRQGTEDSTGDLDLSPREAVIFSTH
jgi:alpha-glucosidase